MRTPETYCYFISLALRLVNFKGTVAYIVPNNMFFQNENEKTRSLLLFDHQLVRAINLGDNTFENADVPTCIFIASSQKDKECYEVKYSDYRTYNIHDVKWEENYESIPADLIKTVPAYVIGLSSNDIRIINEVKQHGVLIDSIAAEMASGISTGGDKIFRISRDYADKLDLEKDILYKVLVGAEINNYQITDKNNVIIYTTKDVDICKHSNIFNYLFVFLKKLSGKRETVNGRLPWWCLHWPRYKELFEEPKIIMRQTADSIRCVYDENGFFVLNSILVLKMNTNQYSYKYVATILNSTFVDYLYKRLTQEEGRTFAEVKPINVRKLYIPKATPEEQALLSILYDYMVFLKSSQLSSMHLVEEMFAQIIDGCVYELFFREHMQEREIDIMRFLYKTIKPIAGLSIQDANDVISAVYNDIYMTDNQIRTRLKLFVSHSPEFLKPIIQH